MTPIGTVLNIKSAIATGAYSVIFLRVSRSSTTEISVKRFSQGSSPTCAKILEEYAMRIPSTTKNSNYYTESNKRFTARRTQATNFIFKGGLTEEMLEHCRANLVNYYVCYGSAVVSVRNAERSWIRPV